MLVTRNTTVSHQIICYVFVYDDIQSKLNCTDVRHVDLMPANEVWFGQKKKEEKWKTETKGRKMRRYVIEITMRGLCDAREKTRQESK